MESFHRSVEFERKFLPQIIKVKLPVSAGIFDGLRNVIVGIGLLTLNVTPLETATAGEVFRTVIVRVLPMATSDEEMAAVNRALLM